VDTVEPDDLTDRVRRGYDALSYAYRGEDRDDNDERCGWVERLIPSLPPGGEVLDLGCGCGEPVARMLAERGFAVTGVDISQVQIDRARRTVPAATFVRADATAVTFAPASFDAIICLYVLIHLPLHAQAPLLERMAAWLKPGGWLLASAGHRAWTGTQENWLGGGAPMWWSHADADTYREWLTDGGYTIVDEEFVPEGDGGHALFWCRRPGQSP
jgi:2-polyprenyl-3-methyl-5-hydroxy-6-metoxy-1,4-benzoquinol methylase